MLNYLAYVWVWWVGIGLLPPLECASILNLRSCWLGVVVGFYLSLPKDVEFYTHAHTHTHTKTKTPPKNPKQNEFPNMFQIQNTMGLVANQRYLGHYQELFGDEQEQLVPTWPTLAWILEDYGFQRTKFVATDLIDNQGSGPWSFEVPPIVQIHPQFCLCKRKHKWSPNAIIASVEYNWPKLQGAPGFNTPTQCREAYQKLFKAHWNH